MDKEAMRKFIWGECLLLSAQKQTQFNKGKRAAYQDMWNELGGDINPAAQAIKEKLERERAV
jgi:hypothetical protein